MNNKIKILIILVIIAIVAVCSVFAIQKTKSVKQNSPQKIEAPKGEINKPEVLQEPVTTDENNIPKSDYKVPEIG